MSQYHLLTINSPKTQKGESSGFLTGILYLAPSMRSGHNVCPMASKGCIAACLNTSGRGVYKRTQDSRLRRTLLFFNERAQFMASIVHDVEALMRAADRKGLTPVVRLNGTSDIRWENESVTRNGEKYRNVMLAFPAIQFYDYTKIPNRRNLPPNYHLTFSVNEVNETTAIEMLKAGMNIAVVFRKHFPDTFWGRRVVSGDTDDLRFRDGDNVVVGLKAKGRARRDTSGFVKEAA